MTQQPLKISKSRYFRQNLRLLVAVMLFVWFFMLIYGLVFYKPLYVSESTVMVRDSAVTASYLEPEQLYGSRTTSSSAANPVLNTMELLKSDAVAQSLWIFLKSKHPSELKKLGIKTHSEWLDEFGDGVNYIKAKNRAGTDLISVKFLWTNPKVAKGGAETVVKAFRSASLDLNQQEQRSRNKYLEAQVGEIAQKLADVRRAKTDYKVMNQTVDVAQEKMELTKFRVQFDSRLNRTLALAQGKEAEVLKFQDMLGMTAEQAIEASAIGRNEAIKTLKKELYSLSQTHAFLATTLTDKNPKVREVKAKIDQIQKDLKRELSQTIGREVNDIEGNTSISDDSRAKIVNQLVSAQAEAIRLTQEADGIETRLDIINNKMLNFPTVEEGLRSIEQEERILSTSVDMLRKKALESKLREAQTLSNVFVVDHPRLAKAPNFPAPMHLLVLSILLGVAAGVAAVVLRYQLDVENRFKVGVERIGNKLDRVLQEEEEEDARFTAQLEDMRQVDGYDVLSYSGAAQTHSRFVYDDSHAAFDPTHAAIEEELKLQRQELDGRLQRLAQREAEIQEKEHAFEESQNVVALYQKETLERVEQDLSTREAELQNLTQKILKEQESLAALREEQKQSSLAFNASNDAAHNELKDVILSKYLESQKLKEINADELNTPEEKAVLSS